MNNHKQQIWMVGIFLILFLQLNESFSQIVVDTIRVKAGWNIVSIPMDVADPRVSAMFPTATSPAFAYYGGYVVQDPLRHGVGYLIKFSSDQNILITGTCREQDTIIIYRGWNLIGSISYPVPVSAGELIPPGLALSDYWEWEGTSFAQAGTITPGSGYWVRSSSPGQIILHSNTCRLEKPPSFNYPPTHTFYAQIGFPLTFPVSSWKSSGGDVTLEAVDLPPGTEMTPALPVTGNPAQSMFSWTPAVSDTGMHIVRFSATDSCGLISYLKFYVAVESPRNILIPLGCKYSGGDSSTIYWGIAPEATNCLDPLLGEDELPPQFPGNELRFALPTSCHSTGAYIDIHPFIAQTQRDTFRITSGGAPNLPLNISWPDLHSYYKGAVSLYDADLDLTIDMKSQNSYSVNTFNNALRIYTADLLIRGVQLKGPPNYSTGVDTVTTLSWFGSPGALSYRLQVALDSGFTNILLDDSSIYTTYRQVGPLPGDPVLYWRVNAKDVDGTTDWSDIWVFSTLKEIIILGLTGQWNLVSVPVQAADFRMQTLFPDAISQAYRYSSGYFSDATLTPGAGYWVKFRSPSMVVLQGAFIQAETLSVRKGWNLIGSISYPVQVASITSDPPGLTTSNFFSYDGAYRVTSSISPGRAYWVKTDQSGRLIPSYAAAGQWARISIVPTGELPPHLRMRI